MQGPERRFKSSPQMPVKFPDGFNLRDQLRRFAAIACIEVGSRQGYLRGQKLSTARIIHFLVELNGTPQRRQSLRGVTHLKVGTIAIRF